MAVRPKKKRIRRIASAPVQHEEWAEVTELGRHSTGKRYAQLRYAGREVSMLYDAPNPVVYLIYPDTWGTRTITRWIKAIKPVIYRAMKDPRMCSPMLFLTKHATQDARRFRNTH